MYYFSALRLSSYCSTPSRVPPSWFWEEPLQHQRSVLPASHLSSEEVLAKWQGATDAYPAQLSAHVWHGADSQRHAASRPATTKASEPSSASSGGSAKILSQGASPFFGSFICGSFISATCRPRSSDPSSLRPVVLALSLRPIDLASP